MTKLFYNNTQHFIVKKQKKGNLMFLHLHTKKRILLNMLLSQLGFAIISTVAILSDYKIAAIISINIVFTIIITYISYNSMKRIVGGIERLKKYLDDLMDFVFFRTNHIRKAQYIKNDDIGYILKELNLYVDKFDEMRKNDMHVLGEIVIALNKVSQGIYTSKIHSDSSNFMIHALKKVVNDMLSKSNDNMEELVSIVEKYTQQDYRSQMKINPILKGKMLITMQRINQLGKELNENAKQNLQNGNLLEKNSTMMNKSVENLASKANEQAASLEETAASLEEITSITKNNTQNASKMANLSKDVKDSVILGEKLAYKTASSMDEINEKVEAINEAINIIDQIAFQTNILSLNAAVEAATAGEAGKGFAVVAQEVRNLASRSAEAAREIKDLVENATSKTSEGKKISDEMSKGYDNLNQLISQTINIIQDVSTASNEQLTGIEQINHAISMLDKVTQENANEANIVANIANETLVMAQLLVKDAKSKKVS
jgi:methyl-accepting chemotaxis protein